MNIKHQNPMFLTVAFLLVLQLTSCAKPSARYQEIKKMGGYPKMTSATPGITTQKVVQGQATINSTTNVEGLNRIHQLTQGLKKSTPPIGSKLSFNAKTTEFFDVNGNKLSQIQVLNLLGDPNNRVDTYYGASGETVLAVIRPATETEKQTQR